MAARDRVNVEGNIWLTKANNKGSSYFEVDAVRFGPLICGSSPNGGPLVKPNFSLTLDATLNSDSNQGCGDPLGSGIDARWVFKPYFERLDIYETSAGFTIEEYWESWREENCGRAWAENPDPTTKRCPPCNCCDNIENFDYKYQEPNYRAKVKFYNPCWKQSFNGQKNADCVEIPDETDQCNTKYNCEEQTDPGVQYQQSLFGGAEYIEIDTEQLVVCDQRACTDRNIFNEGGKGNYLGSTYASVFNFLENWASAGGYDNYLKAEKADVTCAFSSIRDGQNDYCFVCVPTSDDAWKNMGCAPCAIDTCCESSSSSGDDGVVILDILNAITSDSKPGILQKYFMIDGPEIESIDELLNSSSSI
jgi:hypothetical protein